MKNHKKTIKVIAEATIFVGIVLFLYVTGIGCPIKFMTGISCPGCGMTRAWMSALTLRFDLALAYHPLFWILPIVFVLVIVRNRMDSRVFMALLWVIVIALFTIWFVRLVTPMDSNMLSSCVLHEDVVSIDSPRWLEMIRELSAKVLVGKWR